MSQADLVLIHLKKFGGLTPLQALNSYGVFRLAARIADLREAGYKIETVMHSYDTPAATKRYAEYVLAQ